MAEASQTPLGDEAMAIITNLMMANHHPATLTQVRLHRDLGRLTWLAIQLREAELFRDEAVRFASADALAGDRRARLHLVGANVVELPLPLRHARPAPGPFGGNAA